MHSNDQTECAKQYAEQGFAFPLTIFDHSQMASYRAQLDEALVASEPHNLGYKAQLNHPHVIYPFALEIAKSEQLLDYVESIIGPNILLWASTFFFKPPRSEGFVSWHQDLKYWGLSDSEAMVSAWLALDDVDQENGCMRFVPESHQQQLLSHRDTYNETNILFRGQEADIDIDEAQVVHCALKAGQVSLHHGYLLHASSPNRSERPRLGYVMNFIAPHNRQQVSETDFAMLLRGEDLHQHYVSVPPPASNVDPDALQWHQRILDTHLQVQVNGR